MILTVIKKEIVEGFVNLFVKILVGNVIKINVLIDVRNVGNVKEKVEIVEVFVRILAGDVMERNVKMRTAF